VTSLRSHSVVYDIGKRAHSAEHTNQPDTSFLIAEVIASRIDESIKAYFDRGSRSRLPDGQCSHVCGAEDHTLHGVAQADANIAAESHVDATGTLIARP
jgi:hypothetical protein